MLRAAASEADQQDTTITTLTGELVDAREYTAELEANPRDVTSGGVFTATRYFSPTASRIAILEHTTIKASNQEAMTATALNRAVYGARFWLRSVDLSGFIDGIFVNGDDVILEDVTVRDLYRMAHDPAQKNPDGSFGPSHCDGVQHYSGRRHRVLDSTFVTGTQAMPASQTVLVKPGGGPIDEVLYLRAHLSGVVQGNRFTVAEYSGSTPTNVALVDSVLDPVGVPKDRRLYGGVKPAEFSGMSLPDGTALTYERATSLVGSAFPALFA